MPRVAINIVTWNSQDYIAACLEAVFRQTFTDFSVMVVDNASTDHSVSIVQSWTDRGVRLILNPRNEGYAPAHNQAIEATHSEFVLTLNPDVLLTPTFVEKAVAAMESGPHIGSAAGKLLQLSPEQFAAGLDAITAMSDYVIDGTGLVMFKNRRQFLRGHLLDAAQHCLECAPIFGPDGAAAFYRRAMLEDIRLEGDYFDSLFVIYKEDVDLAWRAQLLGWDSLYTPQAVAYHVRGFRPGARKPPSPDLRRKSVRNRWLMHVKNELPGLFFQDMPYILFYDLKILGYLLISEPRSLAAVWDAVCLLPAMIRRRRLIQQRRKRSRREMRRWFV